MIDYAGCLKKIIGSKNWNQCGHASNGDCPCRVRATGTLYEECSDGFWGFGETNETDFPCKYKSFVSFSCYNNIKIIEDEICKI